MPNLGPLSRDRIEGRCHNVTRSTFNRFESRIIWQDEPPHPKPITQTVSFLEWCRVYTLFKGHGTGYNDKMDRWVSTPALKKLYFLTYQQEIDFAEWGVKGTGDFANKFSYFAHVWVDAFGTQWIRIPKATHYPRLFTFPATEWGFRARNNPADVDWFKSTEELIKNMLDSHLQEEDYLHKLLSPSLQRYPPATCTHKWAAQLRSEIWAMLCIHFPLGIDADDLIPAYRKWCSHDLTEPLGDDVQHELFVDHIMSDLVDYERESVCTAVIYPILFKDIKLPHLIRKSLEVSKLHNVRISRLS